MRSSNKPTVLSRDAALAIAPITITPAKTGSTEPRTPAQWTPQDLGGQATSDELTGRYHPHATAPAASPTAVAAARAEMEQQLAEREQQAYTSGYDEGRLEGEIAEGLRLRNAMNAAEAALDALRTQESKWQHTIAENVAAIAVAVARHVIGREVRGDVSGVAELVRRALAEFPIDQPMRIRVNPTDLSLLSIQSSTTGEPVAIAPNRDVRWMADGRILPGGCIVEGRERIIDGRVDTALERLYARLTDPSDV